MKKFIENYVNEKNLKLAKDSWGEMEDEEVIENKRSAIIGYFYGNTLAHFVENLPEKGPLTGKELDEFKRLYFKRMMELDDRLEELLEEWGEEAPELS